MPGFDKTIFMNSTLIAKIPKNKLEELRLSLLKNNMVDVRIYFYFPNDPDPKPTKKGAWLSFEQFPAIIEALEKINKDNSQDISIEFERQKADEKFMVYSSEFKGNKLIHLRIFYKKDNVFQPGKGVSFTIEMLGDFIAALKKAETLKEK